MVKKVEELFESPDGGFLTRDVALGERRKPHRGVLLLEEQDLAGCLCVTPMSRREKARLSQKVEKLVYNGFSGP